MVSECTSALANLGKTEWRPGIDGGYTETSNCRASVSDAKLVEPAFHRNALQF
jgi:hypothetical protein